MVGVDPSVFADATHRPACPGYSSGWERATTRATGASDASQTWEPLGALDSGLAGHRCLLPAPTARRRVLLGRSLRQRLHLSKCFDDMWFLDGVFDPIDGDIIASELRRIETDGRPACGFHDRARQRSP
ncbi:MAG: hypothetical protein ACR2LJ_04530 [Acidimicrobiales bacterium]